MREIYVPHTRHLDTSTLLRSAFRGARPAELLAAGSPAFRHTWLPLLASDLVGLAAGFASAAWLGIGSHVWLLAAAWIGLTALTGAYDRRVLAATASEVRAFAKTAAGSLVAAAVFAVTAPRASLALQWAACVAAVGVLRIGMRRLRATRPVGVLVVGRNEEALAIGRALARGRWSGYRMLGLVEHRPTGIAVLDGVRMVGTTDHVADTIAATGAGAVVVVGSALGPGAVRDVYEQARACGVECWVTSVPARLAPWRIRLNDLDGIPVLAVHGTGGAAWRAAAKRALDIVGSLAALAATAPAFLAIAVAIKADDLTGPVFFRQTRVGQDGRRFRVLKFRTMIDNAERKLEQMKLRNEAEGLLFKIRDDPRITKVGRFLRRTSLDELPQLVNVLKGEMSLVGPRPALPEETDRYRGPLAARLHVKPGMTGLWQVSGRQTLSWADYVHYDLFYAENWSVSLDVRILARTLPAVLKGQGAW